MRVLICDDVAALRQLVAMQLANCGHEVVGEAVDGADAVEKAIALEPDAVVMDLQMPQMDGLEAIRRLRSRGFGRPIVVLTAFPQISGAARARAVGADGYLEKGSPVSELDDLLRTVQAA